MGPISAPASSLLLRQRPLWCCHVCMLQHSCYILPSAPQPALQFFLCLHVFFNLALNLSNPILSDFNFYCGPNMASKDTGATSGSAWNQYIYWNWCHLHHLLYYTVHVTPASSCFLQNFFWGMFLYCIRLPHNELISSGVYVASVVLLSILCTVSIRHNLHLFVVNYFFMKKK